MTLTKISPGQPLTDIQKNGLQLVSLLTGGKRDVVLAIDVTESAGFNDQGRIRLRQIVTDSLKIGDSVYVVPFAQNLVFDDVISVENPLGTPIYFGQKNAENIDKVLAKIPEVLNVKKSVIKIAQNILKFEQAISKY
ncbi:hypothetical protein [Dolichospermum circinale]|uniref:Uncharacterized protein n=1 Tax=Dolichospermum circinale CS-537/01 TaxID=3021739 RepID=A0ABT5A7K0_9CYAN|nr:hypothetical protein [Dolichospermum circinale]MDB9458276.1 hypothetical protein [Dolichospermum circinale CS-545/17]MDB9465724.1 hypothetical protein [Dolichospermum circinale CS-539/09]MDB9470009.1 hypothetical protein [Dolichospermum circinale CS-539]MDB9487930.1 hypothetical protein [Dolichospermum circinale CS-537/01]